MSLNTICWLSLYGAIGFEVAGTYSIKLSDGFSNPLPSVCVLLFYCTSFIMMSYAVRRIDLGVAYAIWSGIGIVAITGIGVFLFREPLTIRKMVSIVVIIIGVISLNLSPANN